MPSSRVDTSWNARHALVLQGGGALGAFELGVARAIYGPRSRFAPDVIAGVSIGAISAVLLGRPAEGFTPLQALEAFWTEVTASQLFPTPLQPYLSLFGAPHFYALNPLWPVDTSFYDLAPLQQTLGKLVNEAALADLKAEPRLVLTATDVAAGELETFRSDKIPLELKHVLASASLPPSFPATEIGGRAFWDGGVFDNTPLGAAIELLDDPERARAVLVANLFPNAAPQPRTLTEVGQRFLNLLFVNKTRSDVKLMRRFDEVARLMADIAARPEAVAALRGLKSYEAVLDQNYLPVPHILDVTRKTPAKAGESGDFSAAGIASRAAEGQARAEEALSGAGLWT